MTHDAGSNLTAPRWTPADDATLLRLRAEGQSAAEIGLVLGRTRRAVLGRGDVLRAAARAGAVEVAPPEPVVAAAPAPELLYDASWSVGKCRPWTASDDDRLATMRREGLSDAQAAAELARTPAAVQARLSKLRLRGLLDAPSRRRPSPWTPERLAEARTMRAEGLTPSQIAVRLGTYPASVGRALRSPETTEDVPGEGVRVGRAVPDHNRTAAAVEEAWAALARAEARHREAIDPILATMREAIVRAGFVDGPDGDDGDGVWPSPEWLVLDHLRRQGLELRRVA